MQTAMAALNRQLKSVGMSQEELRGRMLEEATAETVLERQLKITVTDVTDGRYTLKEEVSGAGLSKPLKVEFTSSAGDTVFVGGFPYRAGAIFLGITIKP